MRILIPTFAAALIMAVLVALDVAKPLGAHPWWSQNTLMIGAPVGLILATLVVRVSSAVKRLVIAIMFTAVAFAIAKYGQTQFAASYAEDALAGKLWYFGWIGVGATVAATLTCLVQLALALPIGRARSLSD